MAKRPKILIAEDEFLTAKLLGLSLEKSFGYEICCVVSTGEQAVQMAGAHHPDIILMDIRLASEMNGIEAAIAINQRYNIPIIFLSGYASRERIAKHPELSSAAVLDKPVDLPALDAVIVSVYSRSAADLVAETNQNEDPDT